MRFLFVLLALLSACTRRNPNICCTDAADCAEQGLPEGTNCPPGLLCRGNQCIADACTNNESCDAAAPFCVDGTCAEICTDDAHCPGAGQIESAFFCEQGLCVECRSSSDCSSSRPVCDASACRGCLKDDECPSTVCDLAMGSCVDPDHVRYASPQGNVANDCSQGAPCTLTKAANQVDGLHPWIRLLPGSYPENWTISNDCYVVATGASLGTGGLTTSTNAQVTVRGLSMNSFTASAPGSALTLIDAKAEIGVTQNSDFKMYRSKVSPNAVYIANNASVTIEKSQVSELLVSTSADNATMSLRITNSLVNRIDISNLRPLSPTSIYVAYSTFHRVGGNVVSCGVDTNTPNGIRYENNVFLGSPGNDAITNNGTKCVFENNVAYPQAVSTGVGTIVANPLLVDPASGDYHLQSASPCVDAAKITFNEPIDDYEGTTRPQGVKRDIGAFEFK